MTTSDPNERPATKEEIRQEANFRFLLRLNRIFLFALFAVALVVTLLSSTQLHFAGLAITAILMGVSQMINRLSMRTVGFATVCAAGLAAIISRMVHEGSPIGPSEIGTAAVGVGAAGVALIFTNKRSGEVNQGIENAAGVIALMALACITAIIARFGTGSITNPTGLVVLEGVAASAELAGEAWKWRVALASLLPFAGLVASYIEPECHQFFWSLVERGFRVLSS